MTYNQFKQMVAAKGWTLSQVRYDEPPTEDLMAAMDAVGLDCWERYVMRLQREYDRRANPR